VSERDSRSGSSSSHAAPASRAALWALALFALSLGLSILLSASGDWEGTELRRAGIAREMLASGDYLVPTFGAEVTLTKPPLHYWLQAGSFALFGEGLVASRLPAAVLHALLVAAALLLGLSYGRREAAAPTAAPFGGRLRYAIAVAALFAIHPILSSFASSAEIDGPFASLIGLALFALCVATQRRGRAQLGYVLLATLFSALALLYKGPPLYLTLVPALIVAWRALGWRNELLLLVLHALPFAVWIVLLQQRPEVSELAATGAAESVGRASSFLWKDFFEIPADSAKLALLTMPLLLLLLLRERRTPSSAAGSSATDARPPHDVGRLLLWAGLGGLFLLLIFPHRATRYALPGVVPMLWWLGHVPAAWLESAALRPPRLRLALALFFAASGLALLIFGPGWLLATPWALLVGAALLHWWRGVASFLVALSLLLITVETVDRRYRDQQAPKSERRVAEEIARITQPDVVTLYGHVPPIVIWELGARADSHEFPKASRELRGRWLVREGFVPQPGDAVEPASLREARERALAPFELRKSFSRGRRGQLLLYERR
jgi:4-amino-4-deoxy-L-arabinose transferase-like glycosyltransferase